MAKMHVIETVLVARYLWAEKRFPQGRGVGVGSILGEETEKREQKKGTRDQNKWTRIARVGD
jgi:hypothetical protein